LCTPKAVRKLVKINGFYFVQSVVTRMSEPKAQQFYIEHKGIATDELKSWFKLVFAHIVHDYAHS